LDEDGTGNEGATELLVLTTGDPDGTTADGLAKLELEGCVTVWKPEFLSAFRIRTSSIVRLRSSTWAACS